MGADITVLNAHTSGGEAVADLLVRYTPDLKGCVIEGDIIPTLIELMGMEQPKEMTGKSLLVRK